MAKRANPMAVHAALSYEIGEAALALGKTPATIRNWVKDGLPVMSSKKPYLISGAAIRTYLRSKHAKAKCALQLNEFYCLRCKAGRAPLGASVSIQPITSKTSLLRGACSHCGGTATRMVSTSQAHDITKALKVKGNTPSEP